MGKLLMLTPHPMSAVVASRGNGAANLLTPDPKEVWSDTEVGSAVTLDIDLGYNQGFDSVFLGSLSNAAVAATWSISSGAASYTTNVNLAGAALRVPDAVGQSPEISHAFWNGAYGGARYVRITLNQPAGSVPISAGVVVIGTSLVTALGHEWGAGRKVIDTGSSTPLSSGGFGIVEGARKGSFSWTFGDLTLAEVDALYALQLDRGETRPLLVAEDPALTAGLRLRLHYGKLTNLRQHERRNPAQSRWEMTIEEWV